jgi:hypothetical protein
MIQDSAGRMKPVDSLSTEIMHKMNRNSSILGLDANQVILGMMTRPEAWREIKLIRTSHKDVNALLGIGESDKSAAFSQFFQFPDEMAGYKLTDVVETAIRKAPGKRDKFDKAVLQVDERVQGHFFACGRYRAMPTTSGSTRWVRFKVCKVPNRTEYGNLRSTILRQWTRA